MRSLILAAVAVTACSDSKPVPAPGSKLSLTVAPLELDGVTDAVYRLTVTNRDGEPVWSRGGITSSRYGGGRGDVTYVAPCDASSSPNDVALEIEALYAGADPLPAGSWSNPAPVGRPLVLSVECFENRDTLVEFNLTIARSANQGFFDMAVNFDQVFCSAKLDCGDADGPLTLLHDPRTGQRDTTMVMGFACTSGPSTPEGLKPTWLWLDSIRITCGDETYQIDPSLGPGNTGAKLPLLFQTGTYRGDETLTGLAKCYWNTAFGVDVDHLATHPDGCTLEVRGTASSTWLDHGRTPANTIFPYIHWQVHFAADPNDPAGRALLCGAPEAPQNTHPIDGEGSQVQTRYTDWGGTRFGFAMGCGTGGEVERVGSFPCEGQVPGRSDTVEVTPTEGGITVSVGAITSPTYALPSRVAERTVGGVSDTCCVDPCCAN